MSIETIFQQYKKDITIDIPNHIISCFFHSDIYGDLLDEYNLQLQYNIGSLHVNEYQTSIDLTSYLIHKDTLEEVGRFSISCITYAASPTIIFASLGISIDDEYSGKGFTRLIMGINLQIFYNIFKNEDKNLVIDADASGGFWEKIGMTRVTENSGDVEGHEKSIVLSDAYNWVFNPKYKTTGEISIPLEQKWCRLEPLFFNTSSMGKISSSPSEETVTKSKKSKKSKGGRKRTRRNKKSFRCKKKNKSKRNCV